MPGDNKRVSTEDDQDLRGSQKRVLLPLLHCQISTVLPHSLVISVLETGGIVG